jgi:ribosome-binding factor A
MRKYSHNRASKIADQIQKDVVEILRKDVKDPRIEWVTISEVEVNQDHSWAKIYWTVLDDKKKDQVAHALHAATGFVRSKLSQGFKTYTIPQIKFIYDDSLVRGAKILDVINRANENNSSDATANELDDDKA